MNIRWFSFAILAAVCQLLDAEQRVAIYHGFGAQIFEVTDEMTEKSSVELSLNFGAVTLRVLSPTNFVISSNNTSEIFDSESEALVKVDGLEPFRLKAVIKQNLLVPSNAGEAELILNSLVRGNGVKIRFSVVGNFEPINLTLKNLNLGYVYSKLIDKYSWKDFGGSRDPSPVSMEVFISKDPAQKGYASITIVANPDLGLHKNFDSVGGGASISVGVKNVFGFFKGEWICGSVETSGTKYLTIKDGGGNIVFRELLPSRYGTSLVGVPWALAKRAAKVAWDNAPFGTIAIDGTYGAETLLYGFRELWKWGVANSGFPSLD